MSNSVIYWFIHYLFWRSVPGSRDLYASKSAVKQKIQLKENFLFASVVWSWCVSLWLWIFHFVFQRCRFAAVSSMHLLTVLTFPLTFSNTVSLNDKLCQRTFLWRFGKSKIWCRLLHSGCAKLAQSHHPDSNCNRLTAANSAQLYLWHHWVSL